ncbi:hypothetical protein I4U23_009917 [Adineta vaga]|nr:hypothetical protein I4U23_009917 [Adineta vaga]
MTKEDYRTTKVDIKDECYCCQARLTGQSIQFAIRSFPFQDPQIYKRPCLICHNVMSRQIRQVRHNKSNLN